MRPHTSRFRYFCNLALLATLAAAAPATGQQARSLPERLMIGPDEYLKATRIEDRGSRIGDRGLEIEDWEIEDFQGVSL